MTYTSLAKRPNGEIVRVWCDESVNVYFDGVAVPMPERGLFVWAAASDTRVGAIVQGHDPLNVRMARVFFDDGEWEEIGRTNGIQCVALAYDESDDDFVAIWTDNDVRKYGVWRRAPADESYKRRLEMLPASMIGTSQGFLDFTANEAGESWVLSDDVPRPNHRFGFPIWQPQRRGPWAIFQCVFRDTGDGVGARHDDGRVFRVSSLPTQIAPKVEIQADGNPIAAISHDAPVDDLFVTFDRWQEVSADLLIPERPAPALPAPIQITLGDAPKGLKLWMGCETYQAPDPRMVPGNVTWSGHKGKPNKADDPRMFTDRANSGPEWWGDRELAFGLWMSDRGEASETVEEEIAFVKSRRAYAIALHCDDFMYQSPELDRAYSRVHTVRLVGIPLAHAVENVADFAAARDGFSAIYPRWGITLNARTHGKNPERFAETIREVMRSLTLPGCTVLLVFGDFLQFEKDWPDAGRLLRELAANLETPALKPGEQPQPAPVEPPTVDPKPSKIRPWERPKGSGTGSKVAIGAGLAALIAAVIQAITGKKAS